MRRPNKSATGRGRCPTPAPPPESVLRPAKAPPRVRRLGVGARPTHRDFRRHALTHLAKQRGRILKIQARFDHAPRDVPYWQAEPARSARMGAGSEAGVGLLAIRHRAPVVPVALVDAHRAHPLRPWLRPPSITVVIGEPIQAPAGTAADDRQAAATFTAEIFERIGDLYQRHTT